MFRTWHRRTVPKLLSPAPEREPSAATAASASPPSLPAAPAARSPRAPPRKVTASSAPCRTISRQRRRRQQRPPRRQRSRREEAGAGRGGEARPRRIPPRAHRLIQPGAAPGFVRSGAPSHGFELRRFSLSEADVRWPPRRRQTTRGDDGLRSHVVLRTGKPACLKTHFSSSSRRCLWTLLHCGGRALFA